MELELKKQSISQQYECAMQKYQDIVIAPTESFGCIIDPEVETLKSSLSKLKRKLKHINMKIELHKLRADNQRLQLETDRHRLVCEVTDFIRSFYYIKISHSTNAMAPSSLESYKSRYDVIYQKMVKLGLKSNPDMEWTSSASYLGPTATDYVFE